MANRYLPAQKATDAAGRRPRTRKNRTCLKTSEAVWKPTHSSFVFIGSFSRSYDSTNLVFESFQSPGKCAIFFNTAWKEKSNEREMERRDFRCRANRHCGPGRPFVRTQP